MTLLLPKGDATAGDLVAYLNPGTWSALVDGMARREGTVYLPRFRMEWGRKLNEDLQAMGMIVPFVYGEADFSGLSDEALQRGLYIDEVKQKTFVNVDEEGTEAAAVTSVEIVERAVPDRFTFRADRPFIFVIRERFSQTILFAGVLVRPPGD